MGKYLKCFKAYDVRGAVPSDLNVGLVYDIGRAFAAEIDPQGPVAVGRDVRPTSEELGNALACGLTDGGCEVLDIGRCGTEMIYHAASLPGMGGGIMITASHNPIEDNGLKCVAAGAVPITSDKTLPAIEERVIRRDFSRAQRPARRGSLLRGDVTTSYVERLLTFVDRRRLAPLRMVVNAGNGCAGPVFDALACHLPFQVLRIHHEPDSRFPHGIPNPMLEENRPATAEAVRNSGAQLGVAWDGDFDRCFFFDEHGEFIEGYYIVGLLAEQILVRYPGAVIVHDPRLYWNTQEIVRQAGGTTAQSMTGHAFIKQTMRAKNAAYGGEMSAHHYFRDFSYCDSGMIPLLLVAEAMSRTGKPLSALVHERQRRYPCSGEQNRKFGDGPQAMEQASEAVRRVRERFEPRATRVDTDDGLSMEFGDTWRFNLRQSQTEPILRLNVEAREDQTLVRNMTAEILALIG